MLPITPESIYDVAELSDVRISPDGTKVVFVRSQPDREKNAYTRAVWIKELGNDVPAEPLSSGIKDGSPRWSPDGSRLAFLSGRDGDGKIYVLPMRGEARVAASFDRPISAFEWSRDGRRFVFAVDNRPDERATEDSDAAAEKPTKEQKAEADKARVDPRIVERVPYRAGTSFIDGETQQLYVVDAPPNFRDAFSATPKRITQMDANHGAPSWNAEGDAIYTTLTREPENPRLYAYHDVVRIPVSDDGPQALMRLTSAGYSCFDAQVSPDGMWVAFTRTKEERLGHHVTTLSLMPAEGGDVIDLTAEIDRDVKDFVWSRNTEYLYFTIEADGATNLYRVTVPAAVGLDAELRKATIPTGIRGRLVEDLRLSDRLVVALRRVGVRTVGELLDFWEQGGTLTEDVKLRIDPLTTGVQDIHSFDVDENGRIVYIASTPTDPSALFVREPSGAVRALYQPNEAFAREHALGAVEAVRYTSDPYTIQGWIVLPPDFKQGEKYPLAVQIHGGPHLQWSPSYPSMFVESRMLASQGYVVFFCNPRGSTGYGEAFAAANWRDWGDGPMRDIMRGVDTVISRGYIDESKLCVTGGSYGGYMTAWIIGHTDRFCAAVSQRGVYNLLSVRNTSDVPLFFDFELGLTPWDDAARLWDMSPLAHVREINTPLLIEHSENDYRVPVEQAEQLFQSLAIMKKQVTLVRYPREGHELSRAGEPKHRIDRLRRIMGWFDQHCKGESRE
jgi:dipeptidyl aminopeptidase/acylaminoacyl peptidase